MKVRRAWGAITSPCGPSPRRVTCLDHLRERKASDRHGLSESETPGTMRRVV